MPLKNLEQSINKSRKFVAVIFGLVITGYISWFLFYNNAPLSVKSSDWGAFGDFVGGILNPLVAFSAFYWLTVSVVIQKEELSKTTYALIEASNAQKEQAITQSRQRFEGTFFQLLLLHQEIVKSIDLYNNKTKHTTSGRDCFKVFYSRLTNQLNNTLFYSTDSSEIETIDYEYITFYKKHQSEIGHYFRSLYNILKFIHTSDIEDKRLYSNLLRAQLSANEMALLFYNCLSTFGREKFKPLIEEYSLLKGMPNELLSSPDHIKYYAGSAFNKKT